VSIGIAASTRRGRSRSRKGKGDTDPPTFLSHLYRSRRPRPYIFWPLITNSTVIVRYVSSITSFICSFLRIYYQRVSPILVVSWGSVKLCRPPIDRSFTISSASKIRLLGGSVSHASITRIADFHSPHLLYLPTEDSRLLFNTWVYLYQYYIY